MHLVQRIAYNPVTTMCGDLSTFARRQMRMMVMWHGDCTRCTFR